MTPAWTRPDRLAALLLVAALAVLGASIAGALHVGPPVPAADASSGARPSGVAPDTRVAAAAQDGDAPARATQAAHAVLAAVARDPFRPDRRRAADRYRLPGEAFVVERPARRAPLPALRLVGTASFGDGGGFAALALHGRAPLLVPVGDTLAGLRLVRVDTGSAMLEGADTVLLLQLDRKLAGRGSR